MIGQLISLSNHSYVRLPLSKRHKILIEYMPSSLSKVLIRSFYQFLFLRKKMTQWFLNFSSPIKFSQFVKFEDILVKSTFGSSWAFFANPAERINKAKEAPKSEVKISFLRPNRSIAHNPTKAKMKFTDAKIRNKKKLFLLKILAKESLQRPASCTFLDADPDFLWLTNFD